MIPPAEPVRPTIPMPSLAPPPRPRPAWVGPRRLAPAALALGVTMGLGVVGIGRLREAMPGLAHSGAHMRLVSLVRGNEPAVTPDYSESARADAKLARKGRSPIAGGLLTIPPTFQSEDGAYDLVVFFHGNTDLVEESFAIAKANCVVVIFNLGIGSGIYEERFASPMILKDIEGRVRDRMEKRGLRRPFQRRLGLAAWSAGYGAIVRMLEQPSIADRVDAVVLLDGIHIGYMGKTQDLNLAGLAPFQRFAERAVRGETLMTITHSEIDPIDYAGTHKTTDALLAAVHVERKDGGVSPAIPPLTTIDGVVPKKKMRLLNPLSEANAGGLHVRGYGGNEPEDHMAHLIQMAATALPDLVEHWAKPPGQAAAPSATPGADAVAAPAVANGEPPAAP